MPSDVIHLGLDLQGGSHLVLEVKLDKAIENHMERLKVDLTNSFRDKGISGVSVERVDPRSFSSKWHPAQRRAGARYPQEPISATCLKPRHRRRAPPAPNFTLTLSREETRALRDYIVDQSLETIRNRIDQFGVSEPMIQRQGIDHILVQLPGIQDPQRAKDIIGKTALLEFKLVDDNVNPEEAVKNGAPPGRQVLVRPGGKGVAGASAGERIPMSWKHGR